MDSLATTRDLDLLRRFLQGFESKDMMQIETKRTGNIFLECRGTEDAIWSEDLPDLVHGSGVPQETVIGTKGRRLQTKPQHAVDGSKMLYQLLGQPREGILPSGKGGRCTNALFRASQRAVGQISIEEHAATLAGHGIWREDLQ